ncbi:unnamed protein product [Peronospora destructor]|uniref:SET domain-containing protein n=1 Tax=Peronospora destructor TaxID=86335 RepID=A0AAV0VIS2_9STRA|nr:unnamed protein product [Peronospora destructor]
MWCVVPADVVRRTRGCVVSNAIEALFIPGMGVGIVAYTHIPKDTLVFQAGHDVWYPFSAEHALETAQQKAPGFLKQWNQLLESNKALSDTSRFVLSAIVLGVHMLVHFPHAKDPNATLKTIANNNLKSYKGARKRAESCSMESASIRRFTSTFSATTIKFVNPKAFFWAISILMSRATSGRNQPFTLVPLFDCFNHADHDECVQEFDPQKGFTIHTTKSYKPGEQLFISYGNHGNLRLLRNYGFTTPDNPYDVVNLPMPIPLQQPNPADLAFSQKRELLLSAAGSQADVPALRSLTIQHDGSLGLNAEHWLAIMLATPDELSDIFTQATMQPAAGADILPSLRLPSSLVRKASAEVRNVVTRRMKQHCSTFEEDDTFLRTNEQKMAPWLRSCLHLRMGEKQMLMRAAAKYS